MTRRWFVFCVALGLLSTALPDGEAGAAPEAGPSAARIAARVQDFYDKTKVFKAGFRQRFWIKSTGQEKNSEGSVIFQKPGKMSWRYTNNGNRVVSDGKTVKVYEAENKQMYEQKIDKSYYPAALSFLVGGGNLLKSFRLRKLSSERMKYEGGYVLEGVPKQATPAYQKILLYVDSKTSQVRRVILLDAQGNRNRFDFVDPTVNEVPPKGEFEFTPPKGTQVIKP
jgi:outer membrane lipoprotein carrier protein